MKKDNVKSKQITREKVIAVVATLCIAVTFCFLTILSWSARTQTPSDEAVDTLTGSTPSDIISARWSIETHRDFIAVEYTNHTDFAWSHTGSICVDQILRGEEWVFIHGEECIRTLPSIGLASGVPAQLTAPLRRMDGSPYEPGQYRIIQRFYPQGTLVDDDVAEVVVEFELR